MITHKQATELSPHNRVPAWYLHTEFHYTGNSPCTRKIGPRSGVKEGVVQCRRTGVTTTWKSAKNKGRFRVPVKFGFYTSSAITEENGKHYHTADDCPLLKTKGEVAS